MTVNMLAEDLFRLAALPPAQLRALAETVSGTLMPDPQVSATPLGYDWGSPVTAGLWRVEVTSPARGGAPGCTFFVKLVRHARLWPELRRRERGEPEQVLGLHGHGQYPLSQARQIGKVPCLSTKIVR